MALSTTRATPPTRTGDGSRRLVPVLLLVLLAAGLAGCDYDNRYHYDLWPITVENRTGITLDIYLDGSFAATIVDGTLTTIPDVEEGGHTLEAYDQAGRLRADRRIDLFREFVWILE